MSASDLDQGELATLFQTGISAINARVYAVKVIISFFERIQSQAFQANCNPLLDVARETYKENVGDIHALHSGLTEKHNLPIQLVYQESGFLFSIRKGDLIEGKLPWGFTNLSMRRGRWMFTSMELVSDHVASNIINVSTHGPQLQKKRNSRMKDALEEALVLSHS